jgi:transposase
MGRGNEFSKEQRSEIIGAHRHGVPLTEISGNSNIPYGTVKYTWQKRDKRPHDQSDVRRSGRPRKVSQESQDQIYQVTRENPSITIREIQSQGVEVHRSTIKRRLAEFRGHYLKYKAKKRPKITRATAAKPRAYEESKRDTCDECLRTEFHSDECSVKIRSGVQQEWV